MLSAALLHVNAGHALPLLLDVAVKGLVVSAATLAALLCLRRAAAAMRHLVLLAGLGVLLGLPMLMALLPRQEFPRPVPALRATPAAPAAVRVPAPPAPMAPPVSEASAAPVPVLPLPTVPPTSETPAAPLEAAPAPVAVRPSLPAPPAVTPASSPVPAMRPGWLVLGWLAGVLACAGRMLTAQARVWRLTRRCPPLPPSLLPSANLEMLPFAALLTGPAGTPPMVWGWPRAALLLPPEAADWPAARLRAVVLHEAAHVRRCDWLTHLLAQAACTLYWFNPLLWLLAARSGAEAERACDDAVLLAGVTPADYAQDLLAVARHLGAGRTQRRASAGAVTMARRSPVRGRLEAILDTRRVRRRVTRRSALLALAAALAVAAPLAILRPAARADEGRTAQTAPTAGVPTEADIAKAQRHLQGLEQERAAYAAAHPNTLSLTQIGYLDGLREQTESYHTWEPLVLGEVARQKGPHARAELLSVFKEHNAWAAQTERNYRAQVEPRIAALPTAQIAREARMHGFDEAVALDKTRVEMMQMEHSLGYPLHVRPDSLAVIAGTALYWEKTGQMSRADSVHVSLLQQKWGQRKRLDDADIDSLIVILRKPSIAPNFNRSDVMQLFGMLLQSSPAQQQKMREAITPFLKSRSHWERDEAQQALKKLCGDAPPPPAQKAQAVPAVPRQATLLKTAAFAPPAADGTPAGQAAPTAGVPTEAEIAQARQHLQDLEKARAGYAAAHPGTLSPTQTAEREKAENALRLQIIQLEKSMTVQDRQEKALRTPAVVAFEEKRHQREERTFDDMDQIRSADAKSVLYPVQAAHWKQVSANASARLRRRQAEIQAMRPPTREGAAEVIRYDSHLKSALAARWRWIQLKSLWYGKYAPWRALGKRPPGGALGTSPLDVTPDQSPRMAETISAALHSARPQPAQQAARTGVYTMTPFTSMKAALLKAAAFATLAASPTLPTASAAPPKPAPKPEAPRPAAQAPTALVPAVGASRWANFALRHTPLWKVRTFTGWDGGGTLPEGVAGVYFLESNRSVLVRATPAGITHIQGILRRLDVSLRPVQLRVAFATVTAADLDTSGLHSDEVPLGGPGATGKSPQLFMEGAEGSAVTAYLAALEKRKAILVAPTITTDINVPATISMEGVALVPGSRSAQVLITPRLDKEGVLTLQMTPPRFPRVDSDANALPTVPIVRPVSNGTTFVLVNPLLPAAGEGERYLLIFVTPTGVTAPDPVTPPQMIP